MSSSRQYTRRKLLVPLDVIDLAQNEVLGQMADFSDGGLMMLCDDIIMANTFYQLRLVLPGPGNYINFSAKSVWCSSDPNEVTLFNVGFQLIDISPVDKAEIFSWCQE